MTRRSFGLTVISASVAGSARAGGATKWALLSDTHVSASTSYANPGNENLQRISGTIDKSFKGMLICGDLATSIGGDPATEADYKVLRSLVDKVKADKTLFAMGNVDDESEYLKVFGKPSDLQKVANKIVIAVDADPVRLVVLDSSNGTDSGPATLGPAQLSWLQKYLHDRHDKPIILFTHFPADTKFPDGQPKITDGLVPIECSLPTVSLKSILAEDPYRSVKAIISGHEHVYSPRTPWPIQASPSSYSIDLLGLPSVKPGGTPYSGWVEALFEKTRITFTLRSV